MVTLTLTFCALALLLGAWAYCMAPDRARAALMLAVVYAAVYWGWANMMGWPKPMMLPDKEAQVIAYHLEEGRAIYLWISEDEPRAYRMPWNMELARQLRQAGKEAQEQGGGLMMNRRRGVPEGERVFYPEPVPELPPKQ